VEKALASSAKKIVDQIIHVKSNDKVLVVTDEAKLSIGRAFTDVCRALGAETVMSIMATTGQHGNEPPASVASAMAASDVVFAPTTYALTHTRARVNAYKAGCRVVILRGVDEEMMIKGAMAVDPAEIKEITARVAKAVEGSREIRVTSSAGTDVRFSAWGRKVFRLDGYFQEEMGFAALPGGECPMSPLEGTTEGTIVFDYSMDGIGRLREPLVLDVRKGQVQSVSGSPEEMHFLQNLFERDQNARNIAEFSVGTNPGARLIGNLAEDKKALGTVHFALGNSLSLGGHVEARVHLDGLLLVPTVITENGRVLVDRGKITV
jgi:leucyl aminopeptidase (aminopeptidase T)